MANQRKEHNVEKHGSVFSRLAVVASQICKILRNSPKIRTYSSSRSSKLGAICQSPYATSY